MSNHTPPPPSPADPVDWDALARYAAGESPAEEAARVHGWLETNPEEARLVDALRGSASAVAFRAPPDLDVEGALRRVNARIAAQRSPTHRNVVGWVGLAAAATIVVLFAARSRSKTTSTGTAPAPVAVAARTYSTPIGQRDSVVLADGSRIVLGPDSRLTVPADYGQGHRAVELHGMAYLEVRHDSTQPFSVHDANAIIDDIGTTFTVEDHGDGSVSVAVQTGSVRLRATGGPADAAGVVLAAGDRGVLDSAGHARQLSGKTTDQDVAWTTGRLVLRDAPFEQVTDQLHRWYGVDVSGDSALLGRHLTAAFTSEPVDQVLRILSLDLGARIERRGDTVIFHATRGRD